MNRNLDFWRGSQWSPYREIEAMRRQMERLFESPFSGLPEMSSKAQNWVTTPSADIDETPTHYLITVDLPGLKKEDVNIEVSENEIHITGERIEEKKDASNHVTERFTGRFERRFVFATPVDSSKVEAAYENGVLKVAAQKHAGQSAQQIRIGDSTTSSKILNQLFGRKAESNGRTTDKIEKM